MITRGKLIHHIESLKEKHDELDREITNLYNHHTDDLKVEALKKQKLKLKDEIAENEKRLSKLD
jgi:uncharacterized protein YdcH (DUF465 family)